MRRILLGIVVAVAVLIALPATARGLRADAFPCPASPVCYDDSAGALYPDLPLGVPQSSQANFFVPGNSLGFLGICTPLPFADTNFCFQAFNYAALGIQTAEVNFLPPTRGRLFNNGADPLLKIEWRFPFAYAALFPDVFVPFQNNPSDPQDPFQIGVQLIFGLDANGALAPGNGFWLNGLADYQYSFAYNADIINGVITPTQIIWSGNTEACDTFSNQVLPCILAVPEPSALALLGLGFLALVVGLRTGRPARMHLA